MEPFFTFIALLHITVHFWHQAIAEHFDYLVGKVVMSETVLFKCRKLKKYMLKCLIISVLLRVALLWVHPRSAEWWMILTLVSHQRNCLGTVKHSPNTPGTVKHSYWAFLVRSLVRSRGFQFSGWRSRVGSRNPRKIGMGVPNILGFVARGCRKMGVPIFWWHRLHELSWTHRRLNCSALGYY